MDDEQLIGCLPLFRMAKAGVDMTAVTTRLMEQALRNVNAANALLDLSWAFMFTGQDDVAQSTQAMALALQQLYHLAPGSGKAGMRLLALMTPGDYLANTPLECLLEGSDVALDILFLGPGLPFPDLLPRHDLLFIAVRESDENLPLLRQLEEHLVRCPEPVVNAPSRLPLLARDMASALLGSAPGIAMPATVRIDRPGLQRLADEAVDFPILLRPVGAHRGQGLVKLDDGAGLDRHLQAISTKTFYVSRFVDYRGPDGLFRKYRIVLIDGRPFAVHLAISSHWMVNYINSRMEKSARKRAEEARFMAEFDQGFARRHAAALLAIHDRLHLQYLVIDCAETPDGRLLLFEVDSAAIVHDNDSPEVFPYKQPQMRKVFAAFRQMLGRAAHA